MCLESLQVRILSGGGCFQAGCFWDADAFRWGWFKVGMLLGCFDVGILLGCFQAGMRLGCFQVGMLLGCFQVVMLSGGNF